MTWERNSGNTTKIRGTNQSYLKTARLSSYSLKLLTYLHAKERNDSFRQNVDVNM